MDIIGSRFPKLDVACVGAGTPLDNPPSAWCVIREDIPLLLIGTGVGVAASCDRLIGAIPSGVVVTNSAHNDLDGLLEILRLRHYRDTPDVINSEPTKLFVPSSIEPTIRERLISDGYLAKSVTPLVELYPLEAYAGQMIDDQFYLISSGPLSVPSPTASSSSINGVTLPQASNGYAPTPSRVIRTAAATQKVSPLVLLSSSLAMGGVAFNFALVTTNHHPCLTIVNAFSPPSAVSSEIGTPANNRLVDQSAANSFAVFVRRSQCVVANLWSGATVASVKASLGISRGQLVHLVGYRPAIASSVPITEWPSTASVATEDSPSPPDSPSASQSIASPFTVAPLIPASHGTTHLQDHLFDFASTDNIILKSCGTGDEFTVPSSSAQYAFRPLGGQEITRGSVARSARASREASRSNSIAPPMVSTVEEVPFAASSSPLPRAQSSTIGREMVVPIQRRDIGRRSLSSSSSGSGGSSNDSQHVRRLGKLADHKGGSYALAVRARYLKLAAMREVSDSASASTTSSSRSTSSSSTPTTVSERLVPPHYQRTPSRRPSQHERVSPPPQVQPYGVTNSIVYRYEEEETLRARAVASEQAKARAHDLQQLLSQADRLYPPSLPHNASVAESDAFAKGGVVAVASEPPTPIPFANETSSDDDDEQVINVRDATTDTRRMALDKGQHSQLLGHLGHSIEVIDPVEAFAILQALSKEANSKHPQSKGTSASSLLAACGVTAINKLKKEYMRSRSLYAPKRINRGTNTDFPESASDSESSESEIQPRVVPTREVRNRKRVSLQTQPDSVAVNSALASRASSTAHHAAPNRSLLALVDDVDRQMNETRGVPQVMPHEETKSIASRQPSVKRPPLPHPPATYTMPTEDKRRTEDDRLRRVESEQPYLRRGDEEQIAFHQTESIPWATRRSAATPLHTEHERIHESNELAEEEPSTMVIEVASGLVIRAESIRRAAVDDEEERHVPIVPLDEDARYGYNSTPLPQSRAVSRTTSLAAKGTSIPQSEAQSTLPVEVASRQMSVLRVSGDGVAPSNRGGMASVMAASEEDMRVISTKDDIIVLNVAVEDLNRMWRDDDVLIINEDEGPALARRQLSEGRPVRSNEEVEEPIRFVQSRSPSPQTSNSLSQSLRRGGAGGSQQALHSGRRSATPSLAMSQREVVVEPLPTYTPTWQPNQAAPPPPAAGWYHRGLIIEREATNNFRDANVTQPNGVRVPEGVVPYYLEVRGGKGSRSRSRSRSNSPQQPLSNSHKDAVEAAPHSAAGYRSADTYQSPGQVYGSKRVWVHDYEDLRRRPVTIMVRPQSSLSTVLKQAGQALGVRSVATLINPHYPYRQVYGNGYPPEGPLKVQHVDQLQHNDSLVLCRKGGIPFDANKRLPSTFYNKGGY